MKHYSFVLIFVLSSAACNLTRNDSTFCNEQVGCDRPDELGSKMFCDIDKLYPGHDFAQQCIVRPEPDACNRAEPCTGESKLHCNDVSSGAKGQCVQCMQSSHCADGQFCDDANACADFSCLPGPQGDVACADSDPSRPYCGAEDQCRECLDSSHCDAPELGICDLESFTCRGCADNGECDSGVCDLATAVCVEQDAIVYISTAGADAADCGSILAPCQSLQFVVDTLVTPTRSTVLMGGGDYPGAVRIENLKVWVVANEPAIFSHPLTPASPLVVDVAGSAQVHLAGIEIAPSAGDANSDAISCGVNASLLLERVHVRGAQDVGIVADNCALSILGSTISGNGGLGISATGGTLSVSGSTISANRGGGMSVTSADFAIRNNFIVGNGELAKSLVGGLAINATTEHQEILEFTTFADNMRGGAGHALKCDVSNLVARSSIFMLSDAVAPTEVVLGCAATYSLFDGDSPMIVGDGNLSAEASFADVSNADYHLVIGSPGIDSADPSATLAVDNDGDARPHGDGYDMGADEVQLP